jgi:hypothetical protein
MISKVFELRDRMTFIPILVTLLKTHDENARYLLRRSGYGHDDDFVMVTRLGGGTSHYANYYWNDRTFQTAHKYIQENWDSLKNGDVIDVEYILGETQTKKISEKIENAY